MTSIEELSRAIVERAKEWDGKANVPQLPLSYMGNEMGGEAGEALEAGLSLALDLVAAGAAAGRAQNITKKLDREAYGMVGSRATVAQLLDELADTVICTVRIAALRYPTVDFGAVIRRKFNAASEANGLKTMMRYEPQPKDT